MENKDYFSKICLCRFKLVPSPVIRIISSSWYGSGVHACVGTPSQGEMYALPFEERGRVESFPCICCFLTAFVTGL